MTSKEASLTWIIPGLMSAILGLVGWMAISINKMSESLAVVAFRIEAQGSYVKDLNKRIQDLEIFAAVTKPRSTPR